MKRNIPLKPELIKADALPSSPGTLALKGSEGYLYAIYTANLRRRWSYLLQLSEEDRVLGDVLQNTNDVELVETDSLLDSLIEHKVFMKHNAPLYQQQLFPPREYVYLGLSAQKFPFVAISEHTTEDWLYAGPFRSRFILADFIDSLSRILKLPYCERGDYPCDKFDKDICRGWCLSLSVEKETDQSRDLEKLEKLLFESYMTPSESVLKLLRAQYDAYFDDLEFEKAELFTDTIEVHEKYRDWLQFLIKAKSLNYSDDKIKVVDGQLASVHYRGAWQDCHVLRTEFRPNEILAMDKAVVDEARVLYDYITTKIEVS